MDDLLNEFLAESVENLETIAPVLERFANRPEDKDMVRVIHSPVSMIERSCGFLDLPRLGAVAGASAAVLARMRISARTPGIEEVELVLNSIVRIRELLVETGKVGVEPIGDDGELIAELAAVGAATGDSGGLRAQA